MDKSLKRIFAFITKFKLEDLPEIIEASFGTTKWQDIKSVALRNKLNLLNVRNVAMICLRIYKENNPPAKDIQKVLWYLKFFDVSCHNNVSWKCALLLNKEEEFPRDMEDLQRRIIRAYRTEARDVEMNARIVQDLIWVMVIEKKITKNGIKFGKPFFVVMNFKLEKQYVFFYPDFKLENTNCADHLLLVSHAIGYESYKKVSFQGKDVVNLFEMIKRHKTDKNEVAVYRPRKFVLENNILDFTQGRERMTYASDVLPPGLTNLSEFTVHEREQWRGARALCRPCKVATQLRIRTKGRNSSVEAVLRELIFLGLISIPVPQYISRLPYLNRNVVQLKLQEEAQDTTNNSQELNEDDEVINRSF